MTISSVSNSNSIAQLYQMREVDQTQNTTKSKSIEMSPPPGPPLGGDFLNAIFQALTQIGAGESTDTTTSSTADSSSSSSSSTASSSDIAQALGSFMQNLMGALHDQSSSTASGSGTETDSEDDGSGNTSGTRSAGHHRPNIENDLQSLIQKLQGSSSTSSTSTTAADFTQSELEQSFQNLLSALGGGSSSSEATLTNFLQAFADNMSGSSTSGSVISTQA